MRPEGNLNRSRVTLKKRFMGLGLVLAAMLVLWGSRGIINFIARHDPDALWYLVHKHCAVSKNHAPCTLYKPEEGYALIKDILGKGQYLLVPTMRISGVESPVLLDAGTPDYLARAWEVRNWVKNAYGRPDLPDHILSLTVNSMPGRSQNQLHIHIDCLRKPVLARIEDLQKTAPDKLAGGAEITLRGHKFRVIGRLSSLTPSPFLLFAGEDEAIRAGHGVAVIDLGREAGEKGGPDSGDFLFLEDRSAGTDWGNAEWIQDHRCLAARAG